MPDYKCTPPKGGGGKALYYVLLVIVILVGLKVEHFLAEYGTYVLIAIGLVTGTIVVTYAYRLYAALKVRTWREDDASVMSKHDAIRVWEETRFPLDGGPVVKGEVLRNEKPAITQGHGEGASGLPAWREGERSGSQRSRTTRYRNRTWPTLRQDESSKPQRPEQ